MSSFKYNKGTFSKSMQQLRDKLGTVVVEAVRDVVEDAADTARQIASWRDAGYQIENYGSAVWEWEVTGMSRTSIQGYVVGAGYLRDQEDRWTTSHKNGYPLQHLHTTDSSVTEQRKSLPGHTVGVVTMNTHYAPYLQAWEIETEGQPVTIEVLDAHWDTVYAPRLRSEIERALR